MKGKKRYPTSISDILSNTPKLKMRQQIPLFNLERSWGEIVGEAIRDHSHPVKLIGTTLIVRVEHPSLMQELSYHKSIMLEKIKGCVPLIKIKDIRFEMGEIPDKASPTDKADQVKFKHALKDEEVEFIDRAAEQISDDEIQEAARRAMTRSFSRKQR